MIETASEISEGIQSKDKYFNKTVNQFIMSKTGN